MSFALLRSTLAIVVYQHTQCRRSINQLASDHRTSPTPMTTYSSRRNCASYSGQWTTTPSAGPRGLAVSVTARRGA